MICYRVLTNRTQRPFIYRGRLLSFGPVQFFTELWVVGPAVGSPEFDGPDPPGTGGGDQGHQRGGSDRKDRHQRPSRRTR